ncbi:MAG: ArsR/SmtB family transcription factor, partial [Halobaculum sp.]
MSESIPSDTDSHAGDGDGQSGDGGGSDAGDDGAGRSGDREAGQSGGRGLERTDGGVVGSNDRRNGVAEGADRPDGVLGDERVAPVTDDGGSTDPESEVRVCWLDDEDAETLINSLSSDTARSILTALHGGHSTASELAEEVDTSVQNVRHHLDNLREAGLAEVAGTRYSVKGREMDVYAPADDRLVVAVGREDDRSSFLDSLRSLLGAVGALLVGS